jgi:hypothetical protein
MVGEGSDGLKVKFLNPDELDGLLETNTLLSPPKKNFAGTVSRGGQDEANCQ